MTEETTQNITNKKKSDIANKIGMGCLAIIGIFIILLQISSIISNSKTNINTESVDGTSLSDEKIQSTAEITATPDPTIAEITYKVVEVVDGDTIKVNINGGTKTVRFIGIDTPETVHPSKPVGCFGKEASDKTKELLEGKSIRLEKDISETDQYGRLLRYVYVSDIFVNDYLVRQGYANASSYPPDVKHQSQFTEAEQEARNNNRGLWGSVCGCEKDKETARECISCNKAKVTKTNWDCSTYTNDVDDSNCTTGCQAVIPTPTPTPTPNPTPSPISNCDCSSNKYNCGDFATHAEAQAVYDCCMTKVGYDIHKLDGNDNDGLACESNP